MTLGDWASIATIVQGIFVIVSIGFIWYQLRENTRLARAANIQQLYGFFMPIHLQEIQDSSLAQLVVQGDKAYDEMNEIDQWRYIKFLHYHLNAYEYLHQLWEERLIEPGIYATWIHGLENIIISPAFVHHWPTLKKTLEPRYVKYIDQLLAARS